MLVPRTFVGGSVGSRWVKVRAFLQSLEIPLLAAVFALRYILDVPLVICFILQLRGKPRWEVSHKLG